MAVDSAELRLYQAVNLALGGRMSAVEVVEGSEQSVHPNFSQAQRSAGATSNAKLFFKISDIENGTLSNCKVMLKLPTPGDTNVKIYAGTQTDLVADHPAPRLYGVGIVSAVGGVSPGDAGFDVEVEADGADIFQTGDTIFLRDDNAYEFLVIDTVSVAGTTVTLTTTTTVVAAYTLAANTSCASCILSGTVETSSSNYSVASAAGTLDEVNNPAVLDNIGTVEETWTLTFTTATAYTVSGAILGVVGVGNRTVDSAITNPDFARDYLTLPFALFTGTYVAGDTVTLKTHPASIGFFSRYEAPVNTAELLTEDEYFFCMFGE